MDEFSAMLDRVYAGREALGLNTIYEDLVAAAAPESVLLAVESMPEGTYRKEEVAAAVNANGGWPAGGPASASRPVEDDQAYGLAADDEAPDPGLDYRGPDRADIDDAIFEEPSAASAPDDYFTDGDGSDISDDGHTVRTGADQPWDPEDLAVAEGRDPTPANVERARRELEEDGPAAIERNVP